jgi:CubicO group peptidase (beta-lactamase class C family)
VIPKALALVVVVTGCGAAHAPAAPAVPVAPAVPAAPAVPSVVAYASRAPALEAIVERARDHAHLLGLAVAVVDHGHVVIEKGYGFTDLDRARPITADTVFAIGSLSKQFTAAAVLRLVDAGKLKLSDRVATYLPAITGDITIQELLWQTAGLAEYAWGINLGKRPDELLRIIGESPRSFASGTKWEYSNSNYFVLGRLVELVANQPYADYLRDQVLARAGLTATGVCGPETAGAHPSVTNAGVLVAGATLDVTFFGGAGAICSNVPDLLRWQDALFGGKVLSPSSLAVMTTAGTLADGTAISYAAGLIPDRVVAHRRIWHNGAIPREYESQLAWYPDDRLQIVLLTNTFQMPPGQTLGRLELALAAEQLQLAGHDVPLAPGQLARHTGRFTTGAITAVVTTDGERLHVHIDGGIDAVLVHHGASRFVLASNPTVEYRFVLPPGDAHAGTVEVWSDDHELAVLARSGD